MFNIKYIRYIRKKFLEAFGCFREPLYVVENITRVDFMLKSEKFFCWTNVSEIYCDTSATVGQTGFPYLVRTSVSRVVHGIVSHGRNYREICTSHELHNTYCAIDAEKWLAFENFALLTACLWCFPLVLFLATVSYMSLDLNTSRYEVLRLTLIWKLHGEDLTCPFLRIL